MQAQVEDTVGHSDQKHTKERLLDAAERLFSVRGIDSTSTRMIAREAETNSAAPNFHFGTKALLVKAVFKRRMIPLWERRVELMNELLSKNPEPDVATLLDSFTYPLLELIQNGDEGERSFLGLLALTTVVPRAELQELLEDDIVEYMRTYLRAMQRALPHLSADEIVVRMDFAVGVLSHALTDPTRRTSMKTSPAWEESHHIQIALRNFIVAGLLAPASSFDADVAREQ